MVFPYLSSEVGDTSHDGGSTSKVATLTVIRSLNQAVLVFVEHTGSLWDSIS